MVSPVREAYSSPVLSMTGRPSMSPRSSTVGPPGVPSRSTAVTEVSGLPVLISREAVERGEHAFLSVRQLETRLGPLVEFPAQPGQVGGDCVGILAQCHVNPPG
jgi:hypothetical protein